MDKSKKYLKLITAFSPFVILIICCVNIFGHSLTWQHIYDYGSIKKIRHLNTGGYIFLSNKRINNQNKIYLGKLDYSGNLLWYKIYGVGESSAYWIEQTSDNGFIIGGSIYLSSSVAYLLKTDSLGNEQWNKTFSFSQLDQLNCVKQTADNGYILSCRTDMTENSSLIAIKTNNTGNVVWQKLYSFPNTIHIREVETINNGYLFVGSINVNISDLLLIRINNDGDTIWTKIFGGIRTDAAHGIEKIGNYAFLIGGYSSSNNQNGESYLVKTDTSGNLLWQKYYSGLYGEICYSVKYKQNYGYILAGYSDTFNIEDSRAFIKIVDTNGVQLNEKSFFPPNRGGVFNDVDLSNDGGYILGGFSNFNTAISMYAVKTDSVLFANPIGIIPSNQQIPKYFSLSQNYPNPFNPVTNIRFDIPQNAHVTISVYDILGQEVYSISEYRTAGSYEFRFEGSNLASGLYFYRLVVEGPERTSSPNGVNSNSMVLYSETKKMVLLK
ncbi:MAG: PKD repeat protein [Chlorobi bacterium OLB5]|nr:MAG: PKD repeat protein [Chlorobi bacterium OLB5]